MKQNTMFPNLVQKFISDEELWPLIELVGYEDTARKLVVKTLIQYLVGEQDFVIRMKESVELSHVKSLQHMLEKESNVTRDITCRLGTIQSRSEKRPPGGLFQRS